MTVKNITKMDREYYVELCENTKYKVRAKNYTGKNIQVK